MFDGLACHREPAPDGNQLTPIKSLNTATTCADSACEVRFSSIESGRHNQDRRRRAIQW